MLFYYFKEVDMPTASGPLSNSQPIYHPPAMEPEQWTTQIAEMHKQLSYTTFQKIIHLFTHFEWISTSSLKNKLEGSLRQLDRSNMTAFTKRDKGFIDIGIRDMRYALDQLKNSATDQPLKDSLNNLQQQLDKLAILRLWTTVETPNQQLQEAYKHGQHTPQDIIKDLLSRASDLTQEDKTIQEKAKGFALLKIAARMGSPQAWLDLGHCYENGIGTQKNAVKAFECYRQAADQGDLVALFNVASCYENGEGVAKDLWKAKELYQQAAAQGDAEAVHKAAEILKRLHDDLIDRYRKAQAGVPHSDPPTTLTSEFTENDFS